MELAEIVMNPVRQRIFQYFLLHETGTVKEIRKALPDIPSASLYRHIKILADCSILMLAKIEFAVQWKAFINSIRMLWLRKMKPEMRYRCRC